MKKIVLTTLMVFCCATIASAQSKGSSAAGVNLGVLTETGYTTFGLGLKYQYNFTDRLRVEPSFNYYFPKSLPFSKISYWDASVNAHYLFPVGKVVLYPLAGLGVLGSKVTVEGFDGFEGFGGFGGDYSDTVFAFNIGGGVDYPLNDTWVLNGELKYKIASGGGVFVPSVGIAYRF